jgi:hypothetical protein
LQNGVYFDHNGDGFRTKSGWVAPNTALLARGVTEGSRVISGNNLFGDNTIMKNGQRAANGFEALKDLDSNNDGIFDANDEAWDELYLWFDLNSNGRADAGELIPLRDSGIVSINLDYEDINYIDANGNAYLQISTATLSDSTQVDVIDIWFAQDVADTKAIDRLPVSDDIKALPQIRGFGTTHSLQQAMMLDESGQLQSLVEQFVVEQNETVRRNLVPQIIHRWTGATTNIAAMEALSGERYMGGTGPNAMKILNQGFDQLAKSVYESLMAQSHYFYLYEMMPQTGGTDEQPIFGMTDVAHEVLDVTNSNKEAGAKLLMGFLSNVYALTMSSMVDVDSFASVMNNTGNTHYEYMIEMLNKNIIKGTNGNNSLTGPNGGNAFITGSGNNTLTSGHGDDLYIFERGFGNSTIISRGGKNIIIMTHVNAASMNVNNRFINSRGAMELIFTGQTGRITIQNPIKTENIIVFADGVVVALCDYINKYDISTVEGLSNIRNDLFGIYRLTADIDMTGVNWQPIGTSAAPFAGKLDGNGYAIKNLSINLPNQNNVGLFSHNIGILTNVELSDATVVGKDNTGGLVGFNRALVEGCKITGASAIKGGSNTGGLVGQNNNDGSIRLSYSLADVQGGQYTGGLVGYHYRGLVERCYATGNISGTSGVGGLVGGIYNNLANLRNSFSTGNASGSTSGGLVGRVVYGGVQINNCYSLSNHVNGLSHSAPTFVSSYFDRNLSTSTKAQGRTTEQLQTQATYVGWAFDTVWEMTEGSYPFLRGLPNPYTVAIEVEEDYEEEAQEEVEEETEEETEEEPVVETESESESEPETNGENDNDTESDTDNDEANEEDDMDDETDYGPEAV